MGERLPSDLTGHFWATSEYVCGLDRWTFKIFDYQNNELLRGLPSSGRQAAAIVLAWDRVIATADQADDLRRR